MSNKKRKAQDDALASKENVNSSLHWNDLKSQQVATFSDNKLAFTFKSNVKSGTADSFNCIIGNIPVYKFSVKIEKHLYLNIGFIANEKKFKERPPPKYENFPIYTLSNKDGLLYGIFSGKITNYKDSHWDEREGKFKSGDYLTVIKEGKTIRFERNKVDLGVAWVNLKEGPLYPFISSSSGTPSGRLVNINKIKLVDASNLSEEEEEVEKEEEEEEENKVNKEVESEKGEEEDEGFMNMEEENNVHDDVEGEKEKVEDEGLALGEGAELELEEEEGGRMGIEDRKVPERELYDEVRECNYEFIFDYSRSPTVANFSQDGTDIFFKSVIDGHVSCVIGNAQVERFTVRIDNAGVLSVGFLEDANDFEENPTINDYSHLFKYTLSNFNGKLAGIMKGRSTKWNKEAAKFMSGDFITCYRQGSKVCFERNKVSLGIGWHQAPLGCLFPFVAATHGTPSFSLIPEKDFDNIDVADLAELSKRVEMDVDEGDGEDEDEEKDDDKDDLDEEERGGGGGGGSVNEGEEVTKNKKGEDEKEKLQEEIEFQEGKVEKTNVNSKDGNAKKIKFYPNLALPGTISFLTNDSLFSYSHVSATLKNVMGESFQNLNSNSDRE